MRNRAILKRKSSYIFPIICLFLVFLVSGTADCQSSWTQIGPEGGDVLDIIVDSLETETVYIAVAASGVYRSQNGGVLWTFFGTGLPDEAVTDLALERAVTPGLLFAATEGSGIFRRTLPGTTWQQTNSGLLSLFVEDVVVDPNQPNSVFAGTAGGVFRSIDAGLSWFDINGTSNELTGANVTALDVGTTSGTLFAAASGRGVFRSDDDGNTWTTINTGLPTPTLLSFTSLAVNPNVPDTVLLGTEDDGVFITLNGGGTWAEGNEGLLSGVDPVEDIRDFAIDTTNTSFLAATEEGVFRRDFAGPPWEPLSSGLSARFTEAIDFNPINPQVLYAGTRFFGIFKSSDGGSTWILSSDGLGAASVRDVVFNPNITSTIHAATFGGGVWSSFDDGATWAPSSVDIDGTFALALAVNPSNPDTLFVGTSGEGVFRSLDEGDNWDILDTGLPAGSTVSTILVDPRSASTLFCVVSGAGVFKRVLPAAWAASNTGLPLSVTDIAMSPSDSNILLATTGGSGVFRTADAGATWTAANTGLGSSSFFTSVAFDPVDASRVFIGGDGVPNFRSGDAGLTWISAGTGLPSDPLVNDILVADGVLLCALDGDGIFRSVNQGDQWTFFSEGLSNLFVNALASNPDDPSEVLAATEGGGIFRIQIEDGDGDEGDGGSPSSLCFIATAAYGDASARQVLLLRRFRDNYLLPTPAGRLVVKIYYHFSPPFADFIEVRPVLRQSARVILEPIVAGCQAYMAYPAGPSRLIRLLVIGFFLSIFLSKRLKYVRE
jgi:hypothetical protein